MGLLESIKNIMSIPDEDDYEDDYEEKVEEKAPEAKKKPISENPSPSRRSESAARVLGGGKIPKPSALIKIRCRSCWLNPIALKM